MQSGLCMEITDSYFHDCSGPLFMYLYPIFLPKGTQSGLQQEKKYHISKSVNKGRNKNNHILGWFWTLAGCFEDTGCKPLANSNCFWPWPSIIRHLKREREKQSLAKMFPQLAKMVLLLLAPLLYLPCSQQSPYTI